MTNYIKKIINLTSNQENVFLKNNEISFFSTHKFCKQKTITLIMGKGALAHIIYFDEM